MDCSHLNIESLLPHRGRMRVVDVLESAEDDTGVARISVRPGSPFQDADGFLKSVWIVELVAQSVACFVGWSWLTKPDKPGRFGYVVAVDDLEAMPEVALAPGDVLHVNITREFELPPAGVFRGEVLLRGKAIGQARLKIFVENGQAFMGERNDEPQTHSRHGR